MLQRLRSPLWATANRLHRLTSYVTMGKVLNSSYSIHFLSQEDGEVSNDVEVKCPTWAHVFGCFYPQAVALLGKTEKL